MSVDFDLPTDLPVELFPVGGCLHQIAHAAVSVWAGAIWDWTAGLAVAAAAILLSTTDLGAP